MGAGARRRARQLYAEGLELHRAGRTDAAEACYRRSLAEDPGLAEAHHLLGLIEHGRGELERAVASLERAVRLGPEDPSVRNNLGNMLTEAGRPGAALAHYRAAIRTEPRRVSAHFNLAKALQQLGRPEQAVRSFEDALALQPGDAQILASLGAALLDAGREADARARCREAVEAGPRLAEAHNNLGLVQLADGEFDAAHASFARALSLDPGYAVAAANLTRTRRFGRDDAEEVSRIERLVERPGLPPALEIDLRFALGKIYDDTERFDLAFDHYARANRLKSARVRFDAAGHQAWAERVLRVFGPGLFAARAGQGIGDERPVFIVGMPRSGTSLVEQILAAHSGVRGGGELPHIARIRAGLDVPPGYPECVPDLEAGRLHAAAAAYVTAIEERTGTESGAGPGAVRVTDKTPTNFLDLGLIALLLPQARVVHCRRDPRDSGLSIFFRHFTSGNAYAYRLEDIAAFHRVYAMLMDGWRSAGLPLRMLDLDYESLIEDPERETRRLLDFCGLDWEPACMEFHRVTRTVYTASSWQVRQPIYGRSAGRWRNYERHLGPLASLDAWRAASTGTTD